MPVPGTETAWTEGLRVQLQPLGHSGASAPFTTDASLQSAQLSPAELARGRAMGPPVRSAFVARRLARLAFAAALLRVPPSSLEPSYTCPECGSGPDIAHGRPGYLLDGVPAPLLLSASQARGWLLLAAVVDPPRELALGVDLESQERTSFDGFDVTVLSPGERGYVAGLPLEDRAQARARLWTRKEAWLKMTGHGLRTPPESLDVLDRPGLHDLVLPDAVQGLPVPDGLVAALALAAGP